MAKSVIARLREAFEYSVVYLWEKVDDVADDLSEEDVRDMATFNALQKSIRAIPHELIELTIQLHSQHPEVFENSLGALCGAVCDTFRPASAAEFVEKLNQDMRSDIELGRSMGRDYARDIQALKAAVPTPVAGET